MTISKAKNAITIDCDEVIQKIKSKYGDSPIVSTKYESVKKSYLEMIEFENATKPDKEQ